MPKEHKIGFGGDAINPDWQAEWNVHNWRNYISNKVKTMWPSFTDEQKIALAEQAEERADQEHWD